jgi:hypothetical protein
LPAVASAAPNAAQVRGHIVGHHVKAVDRKKLGFELAAKNPRAGIARTGDRPAPQRSIDMDRTAGDHLRARGHGSDHNHISLGMHDALAGADRTVQKQRIWLLRCRGHCGRGTGVVGRRRGVGKRRRRIRRRIGKRSGGRRFRGGGGIIAGDDAGLPPAQKQRRHREVEPGWLGAFDAHYLDVALGQVLQKLREALLAARLKNRDVEHNRPPEEKPRRTFEPSV